MEKEFLIKGLFSFISSLPPKLPLDLRSRNLANSALMRSDRFSIEFYGRIIAGLIKDKYVVFGNGQA